MLRIPRVNEQVMDLTKIERLFNEFRFKSSMESNIAHVLSRTGKKTKFFLTTNTSDIYTDGKKIVVGLPEECIGRTYGEIYSMVKASVGHESAHVKWSNFEVMKQYQQEAAKRRIPVSFAQTIYNIVEDGRIERLLCEELPGYIKHIKFLNLVLIEKDGDIRDKEEALSNMISVILYLSVLGIYPKNYTKVIDKKERELIDKKIYPLILKGVMTNSLTTHSEVCLQIVELLKDYIPSSPSQSLMEKLERLASHSYQSSEGEDGKDVADLDSMIEQIIKGQQSRNSSNNKDKSEDNDDKENNSSGGSGNSKEEGEQDNSDDNSQASGQMSFDFNMEDNQDNHNNGSGDSDKDKGDSENGDSKEEDSNSSSNNSSDKSTDDENNDDKGENNSDSKNDDMNDNQQDSEQNSQQNASKDSSQSDNTNENSNENSNEENSESDGSIKDNPVNVIPNHLDSSNFDSDDLTYEEMIEDLYENLQEEIGEETIRAFEKAEKEGKRAAQENKNSYHQAVDLSTINSNYCSRRQEPNFQYTTVNYPKSKPQPEFKMKIHGLRKTFEKILKNDETLYKGQKRGRLDASKLWRLGVNDDSVFKKKNVLDERDYAIEILIDTSGSMDDRRKYKNAMGTAICIEAALTGLPGVEVKTVAFNYSSGSRLRVLKDFNETESRTPSVYNRDITGGCNRDGFAIRVALDELKKHRAKNKLLVVISDGMPSCNVESYRESIADVKNAVREGRKFATVLSILINDGPIHDDTKEVFHEMYESKGSILVDVYNNPEEVMSNLVLYLKRILKK